MISKLTGTISERSLTYVILDVNGVGYKVRLTGESLDKLPQGLEAKVRLWTYLAVREDALDLYGFLEEEEMDLFEKLISISGIGPKTAMTILNLATVGTLRSAIVSGESSYLTKISGIGKKNAEKIVLELKDKIVGTEEEKKGRVTEEEDALEALKGLGYSERDARDALKKLDKSITSTGEKIKNALKHIGK